MSLFIDIQVNSDHLLGSDADLLEALCPVGIFEARTDKLRVRQEREDECILCELCLEKAPRGAIRIRKLYKDEVLVSRGTDKKQGPD